MGTFLFALNWADLIACIDRALPDCVRASAYSLASAATFAQALLISSDMAVGIVSVTSLTLSWRSATSSQALSRPWEFVMTTVRPLLRAINLVLSELSSSRRARRPLRTCSRRKRSSNKLSKDPNMLLTATPRRAAIWTSDSCAVEARL